MATQLAKGNTGVVVGALYAGCDCYFGYPITPSSEVLQEASDYFPRMGRMFLQAESEEASINMLYGAAGMGHRVLTATSGPGFSLMQECLSYMAGAELPCVVVNVVRAGPGLGGIGPEQGDYNQAVKGGGHGNYRTIVLAPNSVQEMCDMTGRAFALSMKYRNPAIVLSDATLGQMIESLTFPTEAIHPTIDSSWALDATSQTNENVVTSINLDIDRQEAHIQRLEQKYAAMELEETDYEANELDDAEVVLVAYGIASRVALGAVHACREEGLKVGCLRLKTLFPFPHTFLASLARKGVKRFIAVEMSFGQMRDDVRLAVGREGVSDVALISRLGGNVVTISQIVDHVKNK